MRIITGRYKGATLRTLPGDTVRPTQDRVREALFSILGDNVRGAAVLDLFAGSGALGLEALSRGASSAAFVEQNRQVAELLKGNIERLGAEACQVYVVPVERILSRLSKDGNVFDLVFLDPPYHKGLVPRTIERLERHNLLSLRCRIVAEHEGRTMPPPEIGRLFRIDSRKYGDTAFSIYSPLHDEEHR